MEQREGEPTLVDPLESVCFSGSTETLCSFKLKMMNSVPDEYNRRQNPLKLHLMAYVGCDEGVNTTETQGQCDVRF